MADKMMVVKNKYVIVCNIVYCHSRLCDNKYRPLK